jgi:hypothetical protein
MSKILLTLIFLLPASALASDSVDLSTPEATLKGYLKCFETADVKCVLKRYYGISSFRINQASTVKYRITKKIVYGPHEVDAWNSKGIVPKSEIGDVQLQVQETFLNHTGMYSYNFRKVHGNWYIISHSAWGVD